MGRLGKVLVLLLVLALPALGFVGHGAFKVATGYSAKQLCSGVFLANLPADFIESHDIRPRLAILGPVLGALKFNVDESAGFAEASLLWVNARATHLDNRGCTLNTTAPGRSALAPGPASTAPAQVSALLEPAYSAAFREPTDGGRNTLALLVARSGDLIAERYAEPVSAGMRMQGWSMNKSLMATWVGMQAAAGQLDPSRALASSPSQRSELTVLDPDLTLLHLLQMESGLDFEEVYGPGSDVTRMLYDADAMWRVPVAVAQAYHPGEHFAYSSGDTVLASLIWQDSLGQPYDAWVRERFSQPLGLNSLIVEADASGVQVGSSYAYLNARDWLRVGQLWLDAWHGRSPLLSQAWLRESVAARPSDSQGRYGRGFWLNTGEVAFKGMPENTFYASGNAGQYVIVIPDWDLVVVRLGLSGSGVSAGMTDFLGELATQQGLLP